MNNRIKLEQINANFDKICYIDFTTKKSEKQGGFMNNSIIDNISQIYGNVDTAVLLFDECKNLVWKNLAAHAARYEHTNSAQFNKRLFTEEALFNLEHSGTAFIVPGALFADVVGIMLTKIDGGFLAVYDSSKMASLTCTKFAIGGFDNFASLVRGRIEKLTLSSAAIERLVDSDDPDVDRMFSSIRRNSYMILRGINNASLLSKYVSGTITLNKCSCDIGELIGALCMSIQSTLKTHIDIKVTIKNPPVIGSIDVKLCERAFLNIIANAIMYTRDGNHISVVVGQNDSGMARIVVKDCGAGIKEENISMATKPYFSVEPANDGGVSPGLGLGLPAASVFCEAHGGALVIDSRFGEGTTVALSFKNEQSNENTFKATVSSYVTDKFSPVYVDLCELCEIPR